MGFSTVRYASLFFHVFATEDSALVSAALRVGQLQIGMQAQQHMSFLPRHLQHMKVVSH